MKRNWDVDKKKCSVKIRVNQKYNKEKSQGLTNFWDFEIFKNFDFSRLSPKKKLRNSINQILNSRYHLHTILS